MARLIRHDATGPVRIDPSTIPAGKAIFICACGLSRNLPICDGSHKPCAKVEQAGTVYVYDKERLKIVEERDDI
ncbi:MAG: iron-binding protein [Planctomycetes bacterium HGW-Planctomycetes-2]|nr:MAG: iron-binding protein [Planctomycetes bacterium HGW-Planctomycetes-2]